MKRTVEVTIMGQKFMVRSESDESYVEQIAEFVNAKIEEISSKAKAIPSLNVAILAAMNIADEFIKTKKEKSIAVNRLEKKIEGMIELIDLQI